jgi:tellurite methyltransferase
MRRPIAGFHQDDEGDWVAELDCLHSQHVRHRPPFQVREWVTTEERRAERIGTALDCPLCDRAELPDSLVVTGTAGPFDETTVPAGLRRAHQTPAGTWGLLRVLAGEVTFSMRTEPPIERNLTAGDIQPIPPRVPHEVRLIGPVRLQVDFLTRPHERLRPSCGRC